MELFGMGFTEILLILVVAMLVMGPSRIVEFGKTLGRLSRSLKKASSDLTSQITRELEEEKKQDTPPADTGKKP